MKKGGFMKETDAREWMRKNGVKRIDFSILEKFVDQAVSGFIGTDLKKGIAIEFPDSLTRAHFVDYVLPWKISMDPRLFGKDGEWDPRGKIQYAGKKYIVCGIKFFREHVRSLMPQKA